VQQGERDERRHEHAVRKVDPGPRDGHAQHEKQRRAAEADHRRGRQPVADQRAPRPRGEPGSLGQQDVADEGAVQADGGVRQADREQHDPGRRPADPAADQERADQRGAGVRQGHDGLVEQPRADAAGTAAGHRARR
jgi:hypothetical protein